MEIIIHPPEGQEFAICKQCQNPYIKDDSEICLWCDLNNLETEVGKCYICDGNVHRFMKISVFELPDGNFGLCCEKCKDENKSLFNPVTEEEFEEYKKYLDKFLSDGINLSGLK